MLSLRTVRVQIGDAESLFNTRTRPLNDAPASSGGSSVVYIMSRDQRVADNHALLAAQRDALDRRLPLIVLFRLYPSVANRLRQHYRFMMDGLEQVERRLAGLNIPLVVTAVDLLESLAEHDPAAIYFDFSPLRGPRALREKNAAQIAAPTYEVDTHNVVPIWEASDKQEYAARTIRPKIHRVLDMYLVEPDRVREHPHTIGGVKPVDWE
ncbi:hypothetical protein BH23CHL2_BH23CHL2_17390 [soil metagenome]